MTISKPVYVYLQRPDNGEWVTVGRYKAGIPGEGHFRYAPSYIDCSDAWCSMGYAATTMTMFAIMPSCITRRHVAGGSRRRLTSYLTQWKRQCVYTCSYRRGASTFPGTRCWVTHIVSDLPVQRRQQATSMTCWHVLRLAMTRWHTGSTRTGKTSCTNGCLTMLPS